MPDIHINCGKSATLHIHLTAISSALDAPDREVKAASPDRLEWSQTLLKGESVTFKDAEKAVAALGDGWRLPTREELLTLVDLTRHDPCIDPEKYPDTKSKWYWTATLCAWNESARWVVNFLSGLVFGYHDAYDACVRAVRASQ